MIICLYRWKLKPGMEPQFQESWRKATLLFRERCGSYGSRLHRSKDGEWIGYAQWPSLEARNFCDVSSAEFRRAFERMREAVEQAFPEEVLEVVDDLLVHASSLES